MSVWYSLAGNFTNSTNSAIAFVVLAANKTTKITPLTIPIARLRSIVLSHLPCLAAASDSELRNRFEVNSVHLS